jgi:hypothetical protein
MTEVPPAPSVTTPSRWTVPGLIALALLPVMFMTVHSLLAMRNAAYWDEIETVLDFLLKLKASPAWPDTLAQLFSTGNEHRTMTSRLLFAVSYWLTGSVNFVIIGIIGNLFIFGVGAVLIATAGTAVRRVQLGVICAFLFFQLQHFENFFWSGSSIDHFQVVTLATVSFAALAQGTRGGVLLAGLSGLLATFTLAHGLLIWPVGALALAHARRWQHLALWGALAALAVGGFLLGYAFNTGHAIGDRSVAGLGRVAHYWLSLLGAPLALGNTVLAPFLGAALLILLGTQLRPKVLARERVALPLALWAVGALLLMAVGRVDVVGGHVHSRYYVLGCLVWALVIYVQLNEWHDPARPYRALLRALPVLVVFNVAANVFAASDARSWITCRDSALHYFMVYGRDGLGPFSLHPAPHYTLRVTREAEEAGIFRMPELCQERKFRAALAVGHIVYYVDRIPVNDALVSIEGWAAVPGRESKPGQIHVVLQSEKSRHIFTTMLWERPDVSAVYPAENWRAAGFRFQQRRGSLPRENFQIGLLIESERGAEFIMTAHRLDLTGQGEGILATGR